MGKDVATMSDVGLSAEKWSIGPQCFYLDKKVGIWFRMLLLHEGIHVT